MDVPTGKSKGKGKSSSNPGPKRTCFLTPEHKMEIATMILAEREVIRGGVGLDSKTTAIRKTQLWQNIFNHVSAMGAVIPDVHHLRKVSIINPTCRILHFIIF